MKTAVLYSGQLREFARCWPTQWWQVLRHYGEVTAFFVVQRNPQAEQLLAPVRERLDGRVHLLELDDPALEVTPAMLRGYNEAPFANAAPPLQLLMQHWYQAQAWAFYERHAYGPDPFDNKASEVVIRMRADNFIHHFRPIYPWTDGVATPWWGRFGGLNDRFAVMDPSAAPDYFGLFDRIPALLAAGCPFHPESLLAAATEQYAHVSANIIFSTARPSGHPQHPQRWPEICPWERAP